MKLVFSDFRKATVKFKITSLEDGWYLSQLIETDDLLSGKTLRKITLGGSESKTAHVMKAVFLQIIVEKCDLVDGTSLRVSGKIVDGPEDVSRGSYHTIELEENQEYTLQKEDWLSYHKTQLQDAIDASKQTLLICVFDRDEAIIARSRQWGIDVLIKIRGDPEKKEKRARTTGTLYKDIITAVSDYDKRLKPEHIILASPAFYKEEVVELIKDAAVKKKIILATCSSADETALTGVLKGPETQHAMKQMRVAEESTLVDTLLSVIAKDGKATYGLMEVRKAAEMGAVRDLLVTITFMKKMRANEQYAALHMLLKQVDASRGEIHIISDEHEAGKKLQGLGGIAALLSFKVE